MPFVNGYFDVVTMLAVIEHVEFDGAAGIFKEIHRILKSGGFFMLTTPAAWTTLPLRIMAKLKLVSSVEVADHKTAYTHEKLLFLFQEAGFSREKVRLGCFELFMNIWAMAAK